jgi:glyoxylase-like metal-dependent hydrolase (beta-lactamase superfamily II)
MLEILLAVATFAVLPSNGLAKAPMAENQAPGYYRVRIGDIEVTALSDGTHTFPIPTVMQAPGDGTGNPRRLLAESRPAETSARLAAEYLSLPFEGSINAFLVNTGDRLVLIDTGAGDLYGACCGKLRASLEAAGYRPDQVDDVLLTHLHADHVGGLMLNGEPVFPNATIHVSRVDETYWLDPAKAAVAPTFLRPMFEGARKVLKPYLDAGRVKPFDYGADVLPGFTPVATPGHTPGHTSYHVRSGSETFVAWGDIVHVAPIQFPDPSVTVTYDSDGDGAGERREGLFAEAARKGFWIGAAHVSFPGLGHVGTRDGTFHWIPANYTTDLKTRVSP